MQLNPKCPIECDQGWRIAAICATEAAISEVHDGYDVGAYRIEKRRAGYQVVDADTIFIIKCFAGNRDRIVPWRVRTGIAQGRVYSQRACQQEGQEK